MGWLVFCEKELNQPGTLVEIEWGEGFSKEKNRTLLIGDINKVCGVCDDCTAFPEDAKVLRYKKVLEKTW